MHPDRDPLPALLRSLGSPQPGVRLQAVRSLGRLGPLVLDALPALERALGDEDPQVREAATIALGQMGEPAVPALGRAATHSDKYVRRQAVWALGRLGPKALAALPSLCTVLKDPDPRISAGAAQALASVGPAAVEAVPALATAMRDANMVLCRLAAKALSQIGPPALPALLGMLDHKDPYVRREAALALGWMGPDALDAVAALVELLRGDGPSAPGVPEPSPAHRTLAALILPRKTGDDSYRVYAAQALGRIGPVARAALPALVQATGDANPALREAALQAIAQIRGPSSGDKVTR